MINIQIEMNMEKFIKMLETFASASATPLEFKFENDEPHAAVLEYGSGIYNSTPGGSKGRIYPKSSSALIIPILSKYSYTQKLTKSGKNRFKSNFKQRASEGAYNAEKYPAIYNKLKQIYGTVLGFIFRPSTKGQRPQRMVRGSVKVLEQHLKYNFVHFLKSSNLTRDDLAFVINDAGIRWFNIIRARTAKLTGRLLSGWKITEKAK